MSGTIISIPRPMSSTSISRGYAPRSTRGSGKPCCIPCGARDTPSVRASLSLVRTSTFRLAAIYVLIFALSVGAVLFYVYWSTANLLENQTDNAIGSEVKAIAEAYRQNGLPGVLEQIMLRTAEENQGI